MNDTPKAIQALFHQLLMQRSGEERLIMGCEMFSTSRALIRSSLAGKGLSESEMAVQIFLRTYRNDFPPEVLEKIMERVRAYWENRQASVAWMKRSAI
jgi:hypothetical protein